MEVIGRRINLTRLPRSGVSSFGVETLLAGMRRVNIEKIKNSSALANTQGEEKLCAADPIMIQSGNVMEFETDYVGTGSFPLQISRTYNHYWRGIGVFGRYWVSNFDYKLVVLGFQTAGPVECTFNGTVAGEPTESCSSTWQQDTSNLLLWRPDGKKIAYRYDDVTDTWLSNSQDSNTKITRNTDGSWVYYNESNGIETYQADGKITSVSNALGIKHTYTYVSDKLNKVKHSSGRQLTFTYSGENLTRITDPAGNAYNYSYLTNEFNDSNTFSRKNALGSVTYPGAPAVQRAYHYDHQYRQGAMTSLDINGVRYSTWTYNNLGQGSSNYLAGNVEHYGFLYDGHGATEVLNPYGHQQIYTFKDVGGRQQIERIKRTPAPFCDVALSSYTYDTEGFKDFAFDWNGNKTDFDYNAKGQLVTKTIAMGTPDQKMYEYEWIAGKNRLKKLTTLELETSNTYLSNGLIETVSFKNLSNFGIQSETRINTYTYDQYTSGIIKKITVDGPLSGTSDSSSSEFNAQGDLIKETNALGHIITYSNFDGLGNPRTITDANGLVVSIVYNSRSQITSRTIQNSTGNQTTSFEYGAKGGITKITLPNSDYYINEYDSAYRLIRTIDRLNNKIEYTYTANSDISAKVIYRSSITMVTPPGCWGGGGGFISKTDEIKQQQLGLRAFWGGCDPVAVESTIDYFAQYFEFDALGRLHSEIGNNGQKTEYFHDKNNNVKEVADSYGRKTKFTYDSLNRVKTATDPNAGVTQYTYDVGGRIHTVTDARGLTTTYNYSGFGELEELISPDTGMTTYSYNKMGQLTLKVLADGTTSSYSYDLLGRIKTENNGGLTRSYYYDQINGSTYGKGRLYYFNDNSGQTLFYYDKAGNVIRKRSKIVSTYYNTYYTYNKMNQVASITYPSGNKVTYNYDNQARILSVTVKIGSTTKTVASNLSYIPFGPRKRLYFGNGLRRDEGHDLDYRLTSIVTSGHQSLAYSYDANNNITNITNGIISSQTQGFGYDLLNRLTSVNSSSGNHGYTYDKVGNRKTHSNGAINETYNYDYNSNQLQLVVKNTNGSNSYRNISYNSNGNTQNDSGKTFTYNSESRLSSYSQNSAVYKYNGFGQRVSKSSTYGSTIFFYDESGRLISEGTSKEYIYLHGKPIAMVKNGALYYIHNDHLGRAERITNQWKTVVWKANNYAFDRVVTQNSIGDYNLGLPGQYWDVEKGSWYNYFRDYDASVGRYVQSDPIGLNGGINTYGFVLGNPITLIDPTGKNYYPGPINEYKHAFERIVFKKIDELARSCTLSCLIMPGLSDAAVVGGNAVAKKLGGEAAKQIVKRYIWPIAAIDSFICLQKCRSSGQKDCNK